MFPTQHPLPTPVLLLSFPLVKGWVILLIVDAQANQNLLLRGSLAKLDSSIGSMRSKVGDSHGLVLIPTIVSMFDSDFDSKPRFTGLAGDGDGAGVRSEVMLGLDKGNTSWFGCM